MRTWQLLLVVTVFVSFILILREAPVAAPVAAQYAANSLRSTPVLSTGVPNREEPPQRVDPPVDVPTVPPSGDGGATAHAQTGGSTNGGGTRDRGVASDGKLSASIAASIAANSNATGASSIVTTVASTGVVPWKKSEPPFMVLGVVSNVMWQDSFSRRQWIRETWKSYDNVGKTVHVVFIVALLQSNLSPIPQEVEARLRKEAEVHGDMLLLARVPERKSPCLKTMAWFRHAVHTYPSATFLAKTDDDAFVQTIKLEANMRPFAKEERVYIGSTLWGSYITKSFEPCARRMGPNMCAGGMKEENCKERGAIGPYPYAVGMLQVLSYKVAAWMVAQEEFAEFERRATAATRPPMMDQGEDMVIGMFLYLSPWPLMPLHWGWDKLHDLCFKCTRKDQIWRPITTQTVVAHHIANEDIIKEVFHNITHGSHFDPRPCGSACQQQILPFEVTSLEDLCSRGGGSIARVYSKCALVRKK